MNTTNKYVCIHGHFYQPPRENAWLEEIELQDSAAPFHDWNERINFECYAPNASARILDGEDRIVKIQNNYSRISFNMGPTLLSWMEEADPETYKEIQEADKLSQIRFSGHGSAIAQAYSHLIMPLANDRDKETQIIWGIRDFESRFNRKPEGMWLAETAVDTDSLVLLAKHGIKYTILAPRQCKAVRTLGANEWTEVNGAVDPRRPYLCKLPDGQSIVLYFYDGNVSQAVAFEGLLNDGHYFSKRLTQTLDEEDDEPQLCHIATDGESYGHHHRMGEMALAHCIQLLEENPSVSLTNYGEYMELFPPEWEAAIFENSSWSCVHGVERWRSNCGCNSGGKPEWNQLWRAPLRDMLNWLRDSLIPIYEKEGAKYLKEVWAARNAFIEIILDRSPEKIDLFLAAHAKKALTEEEKTTVMRLMEMQRHAQLMFTSCGWFFDEISGIETNQILQYANRAIYFAQQLTGVDLHTPFLEKLEAAPSNTFKTGAESYKKNVIPTRVDLSRVAMHYAASSLFEEYPEKLMFFNYVADSEFFKRYVAGNYVMALGRTTVTSTITLSDKHFSFAVLYLGQMDIVGYIALSMDREEFNSIAASLIQSFTDNNLADVLAKMSTLFKGEYFSAWHLFRDEKHKILRRVTEKSLQQAEITFRDIFDDNYQLMAGFTQSAVPIPPVYLNTVQFILNRDLFNYFNNGSSSVRELERLVKEYKKWNISITARQEMELAASEYLFKTLKQALAEEDSTKELENVISLVDEIKELGIQINYWKSQNLYFNTARAYYSYGEKEFPSEEWKNAFDLVGQKLRIHLISV